MVVDEDPASAHLLRRDFTVGGYRVTHVRTQEEALALVAQDPPDLIVLDIALPSSDGVEVCRRIREVSPVPIIIVAGPGSPGDAVRALQLGADDYVTRPFLSRELEARVKAVLRRARGPEQSPRRPRLCVGDLQIEPVQRRVSVRGREVSLSPAEYRLLVLLAAHPGAVLDRDDLLEAVWGPAYRGQYNMLRVVIWRLRRKLGETASNSRYILTHRGTGYMLAEM